MNDILYKYQIETFEECLNFIDNFHLQLLLNANIPIHDDSLVTPYNKLRKRYRELTNAIYCYYSNDRIVYYFRLVAGLESIDEKEESPIDVGELKRLLIKEFRKELQLTELELDNCSDSLSLELTHYE